MASISLTNIHEDLHRRLQERAAQHGRSLNNEIIEYLKEITATSNVLDETLHAFGDFVNRYRWSRLRRRT